MGEVLGNIAYTSKVRSPFHHLALPPQYSATDSLHKRARYISQFFVDKYSSSRGERQNELDSIVLIAPIYILPISHHPFFFVWE